MYEDETLLIFREILCFPPTPTMLKYKEKPVCDLKEGPHPTTWASWPQDSSFINVRNKFQFFLSHSICDILLVQKALKIHNLIN